MTGTNGSTDQVAWRLSVLQLAEQLGNVSEACRRTGMSRTQFYEFHRRFATEGRDGLRDRAPVSRAHPQATPPECVARILALSIEHPSWGCEALARKLGPEKSRPSAVTIQRLLRQHEMGTRYDRWLRLEHRAAREAGALSREQMSFLERMNPCWRVWPDESLSPGGRLVQGVFSVRELRGGRDAYVHAVVDTCSCFAHAMLQATMAPAAAVAVLNNRTLPFYRLRGLTTETVITTNKKTFVGNSAFYGTYVRSCGIECRTASRGDAPVLGYLDRFRATVMRELVRPLLRTATTPDLPTLQDELHRWLSHYNLTRGLLGYPNRGRPPIAVVEAINGAKSNGLD